MNCPKCNAEIADGHRFCTECGYRIVEETPAPEPVHQDVAEPQEQVNAPAAEAAPAEEAVEEVAEAADAE